MVPLAANKKAASQTLMGKACCFTYFTRYIINLKKLVAVR